MKSLITGRNFIHDSLKKKLYIILTSKFVEEKRSSVYN